MPTINRIPMINSSIIPSRKSKENTNNSISANNSNLISNKDNYGRYLVSFKSHIPLTFHEAKGFLRNFNFQFSRYRKLTEEAIQDLNSKVDKLLNITIEHTPLKDRALKCLSRLLNHEDKRVRVRTLQNIGDKVNEHSEIITPKLFYMIMPHGGNLEASSSAPNCAFSILTKFIKIKPQVVAFIPPKKLIGTLEYAHDPSIAFAFLEKCVKADPKLMHRVAKKLSSFENYSYSAFREYFRLHFEGYSDNEVRKAASLVLSKLRITEVEKMAYEGDIIERVPNTFKKNAFRHRHISNRLCKLSDDLLKRVVSYLHLDGPGIYDQASLIPYIPKFNTDFKPKSRLTKVFSYIFKPKKKAQIKENIA